MCLLLGFTVATAQLQYGTLSTALWLRISLDVALLPVLVTAACGLPAASFALIMSKVVGLFTTENLVLPSIMTMLFGIIFLPPFLPYVWPTLSGRARQSSAGQQPFMVPVYLVVGGAIVASLVILLLPGYSAVSRTCFIMPWLTSAFLYQILHDRFPRFVFPELPNEVSERGTGALSLAFIERARVGGNGFRRARPIPAADAVPAAGGASLSGGGLGLDAKPGRGLVPPGEQPRPGRRVPGGRVAGEVPQAPEQADLSRALAAWLRRSLLPGRMPGIEIPEIESLQEARSMLAERVKDWTKQWREEGQQAGEAALLRRQLEFKFGVLDAETQRRIATADSDQLLRWAERVLTAEKIEDIFGE